MKIDQAARLHKLATRTLALLLITLFVVGIWMVADVNAVGTLLEGQQAPVSISIRRPEFILVMILLLLNVMMAYALMRHFSQAGKSIRASLGTIIASMLALSVWIGVHFLPSSILEMIGDVHAQGMHRMEFWFALLLVLSSALGILLMMRRYKRAKPYLVMSAYSKKVRYKNEWISIEEYLERELGIEVSHGITPDERDKVMEDFRSRSKTEGIPTPGDGEEQ
jgi:hypothetical protein